MVRDLTDLEPFFAEEIHDLDGLDTKILGALRDCVAFIVVMHPRGQIARPDGSMHIRASLWIEQEIAIATYIQRFEGRKLPIVAYKHESVGREGLRDLIGLNPIPFTDERQVLDSLPRHLEQWKSLTRSGIQLRLESHESRTQDQHVIRELRLSLVNDTSLRITKFDCDLWLPTGILKHWSAVYANELRGNHPGRRHFRIDETTKGELRPRDTMQLISIDYCTRCALDDAGGISALVAEDVIEAKAWIEGREYSARKTIKDLAIDAESRVDSPEPIRVQRHSNHSAEAAQLLVDDLVSELEDNLAIARAPRIGDSYRRPSSDEWKRNRNRIHLPDGLRADLTDAYQQIGGWTSVVDSGIHPNLGSMALDVTTSSLRSRLPGLIEALKKL